MATTSTEPPLVPLRLPSREQWVLHHVLSTRIERARRSPRTTAPPPPDVYHALQKIESGSLLFTVPELRRSREALTAYLRNGVSDGGERRQVGRIVDRIDQALARRRPLPSR